MKKSKWACWFDCAALALWLGTLTQVNTSHFAAKTLLFSLGLLMLAAGLITGLLARQPKKTVLAAAALLMAYVLMLSFGFQTKTLGDLVPAGYTVKNVEIQPSGVLPKVIWTPDGSTFTKSEGEYGISIVGGSGDSLLSALEKMLIRNYWWPGATQSAVVSDLSLQLEGGSSLDSIRLYSLSKGFAVYIKTDSARSISHWLSFDDLADLLPPEVRQQIE